MFWHTVLEKEETNEVINLSDDKFEYYKNNVLIIHGELDEETKESINELKKEGFKKVY